MAITGLTEGSLIPVQYGGSARTSRRVPITHPPPKGLDTP